jgi:DNA repair protein RadC
VKFIIRDSRPVSVPGTSADTVVSGDSPAVLYQFFRDVVEAEPTFEPEKELLVLVCLNTRLVMKGWHVVSLGSLNECVARVREVLRPVLLTGSYGFALVHNHPSGDPTPSEADRRFTRRIDEAAQLMELRLLDHVIIGKSAEGRGPYFSFREAGMI